MAKQKKTTPMEVTVSAGKRFVTFTDSVPAGDRRYFRFTSEGDASKFE